MSDFLICRCGHEQEVKDKEREICKACKRPGCWLFEENPCNSITRMVRVISANHSKATKALNHVTKCLVDMQGERLTARSVNEILCEVGRIQGA